MWAIGTCLGLLPKSVRVWMLEAGLPDTALINSNNSFWLALLAKRSFFLTVKERSFSTSPSLLQGELHFLPKPLSIVFTTPSVPLVGDRNLRRKDVTALRCSEPLRYKVDGASKPSPNCAGWDRRGITCYNLLVETTIFVPHCSIALRLSPLE